MNFTAGLCAIIIYLTQRFIQAVQIHPVNFVKRLFKKVQNPLNNQIKSLLLAYEAVRLL